MKPMLPALRSRSILASLVLLLLCLGIWLVGSGADALSGSDKDASTADAKGSWPMYGGTIQRNMVNTTDKNIPKTWTVDADKENWKNIKWVSTLGSQAYGSPVISNGKIIIGTNNGSPRNQRDTKKAPETEKVVPIDKGVLMCFDQETGKFLWQAVYDKLPTGRVNDWPEVGICSSPVVEGDRLYFVSNRAELICASVNGYGDGKGMEPTMPDVKNAQGKVIRSYREKTDGGVIWRLDMMKELGVFPHSASTCSPLIVGDTIFLITGNGVDQGHINIPKPEAPSFLAVNKHTGKVIWQNNFPTARLLAPNEGIEKLRNKGLVVMHGQWSNPVYAELKDGKSQVIFPGGDGWLYAFNPKNGELIWKFDCNPTDVDYQRGHNAIRSDFVCTPVIWENKLYIGTGQDPEHEKGVGHLWCIDITKVPMNNEKNLSPADNNFDPTAPANKDSGLVWHYGGLNKTKPQEGRPYLFGRTLSTVSVHEGLLYTSELEGIVHCFDARKGTHYWEYDMEADTWSSPYWVNGFIYIGNEMGKILVFKHGKEKPEPTTIDMNCGYVRATPVAVNGVFYVLTENPTQLWAISKDGK